MFESMTCLFQASLDDLSTTWSLDQAKKVGCHGSIEPGMYEGAQGIENKEENLSLESNNCSDNDIRFAYLSRPGYYNVTTLKEYIFPTVFQLRTKSSDIALNGNKVFTPNRVFYNTDSKSL